MTAPEPIEKASHPTFTQALRNQPKTVWIIAFATIIAFMGIGLVDPILVSISQGLHATPSQTTLLFSSYLGVQVIAMLATGAIAYRFGAKNTLLAGLILIALATAICAMANDINFLVGLRAVWGLGNALFIATGLAVIVGAATGGQQSAILLYEAAIGTGLAIGPLIGAALGSVSWRAPFAGTALLMSIGIILCTTMLPKDLGQTPIVRLRDPLLALKNKALLVTSIGSSFYTAAFFTILSWTPFLLHSGPYYIGAVFFGWGLALAISSVFLAPKIAAKLGDHTGAIISVILYGALMLLISVGNNIIIVAAVIISGIFSGILNTLFTGAAMSASTDARAAASAGYNFCRWAGGAIAATMVGHFAHWFGSPRAPFLIAALCCLIAATCLILYAPQNRRTLPIAAAVIGAD